ncbi:hypothetical protein CsatA_026560 [Cannabis sativa]
MNFLLCSINTLKVLYDISGVEVGQHFYWQIGGFQVHAQVLITSWVTVSGRQFLWGVGLPKGNGGVQRSPRARRRLALECKGRRELDCKTHPSSRDESRP